MKNMKLFSTAILLLSLISNTAAAADLSNLWSYGLTSVRTGEPVIKEGGQHRIDAAIVRYGYNTVVDASGRSLKPTAAPLHGGEQLVATATFVDDANTREYARIVSIVAPIRDAILYDFEKMDRGDWREITAILTLNGIKVEVAPNLDRRSILSTEQVWDYIQQDPSDGSPVMRYLEEAGLELKCLAFVGFNFVNPQGTNHCAEHGLVEGTGIRLN